MLYQLLTSQWWLQYRHVLWQMRYMGFLSIFSDSLHPFIVFA